MGRGEGHHLTFPAAKTAGREAKAEPFAAGRVSLAVSDSQQYLERARTFAGQAGLAATEEARHGFLRLAATYAELARDAATFERVHGTSLTVEEDAA